MDMQSQMTRPYGHDQVEDPMKIDHPKEEEHQEKGASKVLKKVKEKAKKIKNNLTKHGHGHEHDQDVDEEDDEYDEQDPEMHGAPVYESSAVRGGVTGQPESLSHPGETNVPAPEEIIPPGTKFFPVVSSDYTRPIELEPFPHGHEALSHPVKMLDREERREETTHPFRVSELSDREESREAHQMPMNTPASLLSATEDVTRTFAPGENESLGGQRKVNIERPKGLEEDPAAPGGGSEYLSDVSNYQSKVSDPTQQGGGEAGVPEIVESFGRMKVADESSDKKLVPGLGSDLPRRSHELCVKFESGIGKDSPMGFGDFPSRSHELGVKTDSEIGKNSSTGFGGESGAGEYFPAKSHELGLKTESGIGKDLPMGNDGESGPGLEKEYLPRSHDYDDVKVETKLGRDLPTGTHDQFSPELSRPKERDDFDSKDEETRDETHEPKPSTYTDKISSATSNITNKAIAAKNVVASKLGYSGETGREGIDGQHEIHETPRSATGYGQKVAGTVAEKLTPVYEKVKETGSTVMTKLPFSGGGSGAVKIEKIEDKGVPGRDYLAEKLRPGDSDKALSEVITEKLHLGEKKKTTTKEVEVTVEKIPADQILEEKGHGEVVAEEGKRGGMVRKLKGTVNSWLGGTMEEMKPKSGSVEESSQSLGSTVGTMGFSDSGGTVPTNRGL